MKLSNRIESMQFLQIHKLVSFAGGLMVNV